MNALDRHNTSINLLTEYAANRVASSAEAKGIEHTRFGNFITFPASAGVEVIPGAQGIVGVVRNGIAIASVIEGEEIERKAA